jgi:hypothetical protein
VNIDHDSKINIRGDLRIITRDSTSLDVLGVFEKKNVITYLATESLVKLMAPNAVYGATIQQETQIKSMRFGTSNATPQRTDTDLAAEVPAARKELFDANRLVGAAGTIEFTATLGAGDANGFTLREAGLFTRGTDDDPLITTPNPTSIFSRQVYPDQPKTAAITLEYRWRITFTV